MGETLEIIRTRRSIRKFRPEPIPRDTLDAVIRAGLCAPSGKNRQTPLIIAVTDPQVIHRLSQTNSRILGTENDPFYGAPAVLVVLAEKFWPTYVYDGSLVMGNLMLAAHDLGLGSCWIHRARETFQLPEWQEWLRTLGITGECEGIGFCLLGYAQGEYPGELPRRENRVYYVEEGSGM